MTSTQRPPRRLTNFLHETILRERRVTHPMATASSVMRELDAAHTRLYGMVVDPSQIHRVGPAAAEVYALLVALADARLFDLEDEAERLVHDLRLARLRARRTA